jgi:amino acid adenylation domain-containing protein/non-ribosomal peptide synthase protein (TIGR01720 family)
MNREHIEAICPLTPVQEGLLFHSLYSPNAGTYVNQHLIEFQGSLNYDAFVQSWKYLVKRHQILRASYFWREHKEPLQVIVKEGDIDIELIKLLHLSKREQEKYVEEYICRDKYIDFDLGKAPLIRLVMFQYRPDAYWFYWCNHHLILDGWSAALLAKELLIVYEAISQKREVTLPVAPLYTDYLSWLKRQDKEEAERFWRSLLDNYAEPGRLLVDLSANRKRNIDSKNNAYASYEYRLEEEKTKRIESFSKRYGITLNTIVQGAWAILLSKYKGSNDVVFGQTSSGRNWNVPGVDQIVGLMISTLPVRVKVEPNTNVIEFLRSLQSLNLRMREYEYSSLVDIQRWSSIPRGSQLFDTLLVFENYPVDETIISGSGGLKIKKTTVMENTNYPLTLTIGPGKSLLLQVSYDVNQFGELEIRQVIEHFSRLILEVSSKAEQPIERLKMLAAEDELRYVNKNQTIVSSYTSIDQFISTQADRTPNKIAVIHNERKFSYEEIDRRSTQIALQLRQLGAGPEKIVAIAMKRSPEMIIAMLGILKSGAAYLPMDLNYPQQRLSFMLQDTKPILTIADKSSHPRIAELTASTKRLISLEELMSKDGEDLNEDIQVSISPDNLAYLIYTSGSTGIPKGVAITHRSATAFLQWVKDTFSAKEMEYVAASTSICFDLSIFEIFGTLSCGGTIILLENLLYLKVCKDASLITLINTVPSVMNELIQNSQIPGSVQTINLAGEPLSNRLVERLYKEPQVEKIFNLYGPSEDTTYSTYSLISLNETGQPMTIGRPISNTEVYLLSPFLEHVPLGVAGELYIGGEGLARCYFNRPALTSERFIPNMFSNRMGARLYRTGDFARYRLDGKIEFLGRRDEQIKIRGFRIELEEIKAILDAHPNVSNSAVIVKETEDGEKKIIAYVVARDKKILIEEYRTYLSSKLPDYMLPSGFILLPSLPITSTGKVDKQALAVSDKLLISSSRPIVAPRNSYEERLLQIWSKILRKDDISIHDNFFSIGGDSLLTIRVCARAQEAGLSITLRQFYDNPTIAKLAVSLLKTDRSKNIRKIETGTVQLSPSQLYFFDFVHTNPDYYNLSGLLRVNTRLSSEEWSQLASKIAEQHDALRLRFIKNGDDWTANIISTVKDSPFSYLNLQRIDPSKQEEFIRSSAIEYQSSLNLTDGPIFRLIYFDTGKVETSRLMYLLHHLAGDGQSLFILMEDLELGINLLSKGKQIELPIRTATWQEFVNERARVEDLDRLKPAIKYWLQKAKENTDLIPCDFNSSRNINADACDIRRTYSLSETKTILDMTNKYTGAGIQALFADALAYAFNLWTKSNRIQFDWITHGREHIKDLNTNRTVGYFSSRIPVILASNRNLDSVREELEELAKYASSWSTLRYYYPDIHIREQLHGVSRSQISFNYLGNMDHLINLNGLVQVVEDWNIPVRDPMQERACLIELFAAIQSEKLQITWRYNKTYHKQSTIEMLVNNFDERLLSYAVAV